MFKKILITFFTATLTVFLLYGSITLYAKTNEKRNFRNTKTYSEAFDAYNGEMSDFFDKKIAKLVETVRSDGFYQNAEKKKLFLPPATLLDSDILDQIVVKCGDENLSSYCVSMVALKKYEEYISHITPMRSNISFPSGRTATSIDEILNSMSRRDQEINKQTEEAKAVMEATVSSYNEFRLAYPMHIKYAEILKQLTKYKLILKDIRLRAAEFPNRFVDVSTSQCQ